MSTTPKSKNIEVQRKKRRRRAKIGMGISFVLLLMLIFTTGWRTEYATQRTGPQWWLQLDEGMIKFGAAELAGGPGPAGWQCRVNTWELQLEWLPKVHTRQGWFLIKLPLWIPLVLAGGVTLIAHCRSRIISKGCCPKCGYDLRGEDGKLANCPECGAKRI